MRALLQPDRFKSPSYAPDSLYSYIFVKIVKSIVLYVSYWSLKKGDGHIFENCDLLSKYAHLTIALKDVHMHAMLLLSCACLYTSNRWFLSHLFAIVHYMYQHNHSYCRINIKSIVCRKIHSKKTDGLFFKSWAYFFKKLHICLPVSLHSQN